MRISFALPLLAAALATLPALQAHHSFAAEFDTAKPVKMTGTVTKVELRNPHAWVYLNVKQADGTVVEERVELAGTVGLAQRGFDQRSLKVGDVVTFEAWPPKDPVAPMMRAVRVMERLRCS